MEKYLICDFEKEGAEKQAREPVIRKMKNGTIVCTFLTGGPMEPHNENVVKISRSYDDGKTWSLPQTLFSHSSRGCWATEIFTEGENPLMIVHTYNAENHYAELQTYCSYTFDNGESWTTPLSMPSGINGVSIRQGIKMTNGEWLFPLYWQEERLNFDWNEKSEGERLNVKFCCGVAVSGDSGKTYSRFGYLKCDEVFWEPNCIEAENGHIIMFMRNRSGYLYKSNSFDYGRTWSEPEKTDIPNADTKLTLIKIKGNIFLISNFNNKPDRTNLEIRKSCDNGATFNEVLKLEEPQKHFFYPHAFCDDEKQMLYVSYENMHQHYLAKISYDELGIL